MFIELILSRVVIFEDTTYVRQACRPQSSLLSWIGHLGSFKVILIGVGRNPERGVVFISETDVAEID